MTNNKLIKLYSKDKKSLKNFIQLLNKINKRWKNLTFVYKNIKNKNKKITILKSPHVNKKAQTQYQSIIYSTLIKYSSLEIKKNYILLKKIRNHLFPDIKIKLIQTISTKKTKTLIKNQFLPKKIYYYKNTDILFKTRTKKLLNFTKNTENKKVLVKKTLQFLKVLDHYGTSH